VKGGEWEMEVNGYPVISMASAMISNKYMVLCDDDTYRELVKSGRDKMSSQGCSVCCDV
jgi:hypothetical protein